MGSTHLDPRSLSVYEQLVRVWRPVEERLSAALGPEPDRRRGEAGMSAEAPELTIIVPVYNEQATLARRSSRSLAAEVPSRASSSWSSTTARATARAILARGSGPAVRCIRHE